MFVLLIDFVLRMVILFPIFLVFLTRYLLHNATDVPFVIPQSFVAGQIVPIKFKLNGIVYSFELKTKGLGSEGGIISKDGSPLLYYSSSHFAIRDLPGANFRGRLSDLFNGHQPGKEAHTVFLTRDRSKTSSIALLKLPKGRIHGVILHIHEVAIYNFLAAIMTGQPTFSYFNLNAFADCRIFTLSAGDLFKLASDIYGVPPQPHSTVCSDDVPPQPVVHEFSDDDIILFLLIGFLCYILQINDQNLGNWGLLKGILKIIDFDLFSTHVKFQRSPPSRGEILTYKSAEQVYDFLTCYFYFLRDVPFYDFLESKQNLLILKAILKMNDLFSNLKYPSIHIISNPPWQFQEEISIDLIEKILDFPDYSFYQSFMGQFHFNIPPSNIGEVLTFILK